MSKQACTLHKNCDRSVWLIGGTSESAKLASALLAAHIPFVVTVTTKAARQLYPEPTRVVVGQLTPDRMEDFVRTYCIGCVLDASHPFASVISKSAIATVQQIEAKNQAIAYIRYERRTVSKGDVQTSAGCDRTLTFESIETLFDHLQHHKHRILFTLGYRTLVSYASHIAKLRQKSQLFARILPSPAAISAAVAVGFSSKEIVALRPPISYDLEKAIWQRWNISCVVAKASGEASGEIVKRQLAAELDVRLALLKRPQITYPHQTEDISQAVQFCKEQLSSCCYLR